MEMFRIVDFERFFVQDNPRKFINSRLQSYTHQFSLFESQRLTAGIPITMTNKGPFVKSDQVPAACLSILTNDRSLGILQSLHLEVVIRKFNWKIGKSSRARTWI